MLLTSLFVIGVVWEVLSRSYGVPFLFPRPMDVVDNLVANTANGRLIEATGASLGRIFSGFLLGSLLGVLLGLLFGASKIFLGLTAPFVTFFRFVPPLAWFAPALVWFGAGETSKIVLVMYTSVFVVALSTLEARTGIPQDMQRMASATGISWWQRMMWVTLPGSVPYIIAGARIALGNAYMTIVSAEMLGAASGLGVTINNGMTTTNIPSVFSAILVLGILGLVSDRIFVILMNTLGRKYQSSPGQAVA
ncbi:ABC transporter permease [Nesterenkonia populi]|uniref:ABC transporter permease n=1 Tax=Nesterenkonia populi TaxID=1591087 RepID=UPI001FE56A21|nr:ABC transporter permease [Nesterenkonia populi]